MSRLRLNVLRTQINDMLPDNVTQLISPIAVRTLMQNIVDSTVQVAAWIATNTATNGFPLTTTGQIVPMPSAASGVGDPTLVSLDIAARQYTVQASAVGYSLIIRCYVTLGAVANDNPSLVLYVNGAATMFSADITGLGLTEPQSMGFVAFINAAVAGTIDMRLQMLSGTGNVNILNAEMDVSLQPTN